MPLSTMQPSVHRSGVVAPPMTPHDIPKEDTGGGTTSGCLYKHKRMEWNLLHLAVSYAECVWRCAAEKFIWFYLVQVRSIN